MTSTSIQASAEGIGTASRALQQLNWSKLELANRAQLSIDIINRFFNSQTLARSSFYQICNTLNLHWENIADIRYRFNDQDLNLFVSQLRNTIKEYIVANCGKMRILDMTHTVDITNIFTDINILTSIPRSEDLSMSNFPKTRDDFSRYCIQQISERKVPSLDVIQRFSSLMIFGKPGSGKTTFLKRLALLCLENDNRLNFDGVPFFVPLKKIAEDTRHISNAGLDLIPYIGLSHQNNCRESIDLSILESILIAGKGMILLDGLDEVSDCDYPRIKNMLDRLLSEYPDNKIVVTCRIAARDYRYNDLREVEIADFNDEQVTKFVEQFFSNYGFNISESRSKIFLEKIKDEKNRSIKELTSSPLLLTLLCLEFNEFGDFPRNRAELYGRGLRVMLHKWDANREIDRSEMNRGGQMYRDLSLERRIYLLSWIAFKYFKKQEYFFKQMHLQETIISYIINISTTFISNQESDLAINSLGVLKAIETQHGLLIERARDIYSFSHLTFQEYFTANYIKSKNNRFTFMQLIDNITDKKWNDVFIMTIQILDNADDLFVLMKNKIDNILAENMRLQDFLQRLYKMTKTVSKNNKPAATRAFCFNLALNLSPDRQFDIDLDLALTFARHLKDHHLALDLEMGSYRNINLALMLASDHTLSQDISLIVTFYQNLNRTFTRIITYSNNNSHMQREIRSLQQDLPRVPKFMNAKKQREWWEQNSNNYQLWWQNDGKNWIDRLRAIAMTHRDIGDDLRFDSEELNLLEQYYNANYLLVQCLMSECYVSNNVRDYVQETLLLPMLEIEKITPPTIIEEEI